MKKLLMATAISLTIATGAWAGKIPQSEFSGIKAIIQAYGYRCDNVQQALTALGFWDAVKGGSGIQVWCNDWRYRYTIEDIGGRIVVKVVK